MRKLLYVSFEELLTEGVGAVERKLRELDRHAPSDIETVMFRATEVTRDGQVAVEAEYQPTLAGVVDDLWWRADAAYGDDVDEDPMLADLLNRVIGKAVEGTDHVSADVRVRAFRELDTVIAVLRDIYKAWADPNPYDAYLVPED